MDWLDLVIAGGALLAGLWGIAMRRRAASLQLRLRRALPGLAGSWPGTPEAMARWIGLVGGVVVAGAVVVIIGRLL